MNLEDNGAKNISKIVLAIGLVNWIIVIITLFSRTSPQSFGNLIYSIIPALLCIAFTIKVHKGYWVIILFINILFVLFYFTGFIFFYYGSMHV